MTGNVSDGWPWLSALKHLCVLAFTLASLACWPTASAARVENGLPREIVTQPPLLAKLAESLPNRTYADQQAFARIAIAEMLAEYETEFYRVARDSAAAGRRAKRRQRWGSATGAFLARLDALLGEVETGSELDIFVDQRGTVQVLVAKQPVIISSPKLDKPEELERTIVERFCLIYGCPAQITALNSGAQSLSYGVWGFGNNQGPTLSTSDGVHFVFANIEARDRKQLRCLEIVQDLRALAARLREVTELGYTIEWNQLNLQASADGMHKVIINERGDYLYVALPAMATAPDLRSEVLPWLEAKTQGYSPSLIVYQAERLLLNVHSQ